MSTFHIGPNEADYYHEYNEDYDNNDNLVGSSFATSGVPVLGAAATEEPEGRDESRDFVLSCFAVDQHDAAFGSLVENFGCESFDFVEIRGQEAS